MGEAIFAKYSKGGGGNFVIPPELTISNSTKIGLGLDRNATLDDCLKLIGKASNAIDSDYATIVVTLKDADGNTLPGHNITMQPVSGTALTYTTDGTGQCMFKTNAGQATFRDNSNNGYIDINCANDQVVSCPVGTVKEIEMIRWKKYSNGASLGTYSSSMSFKFSPYAGTVDVSLRGGDGQGGMCSSIIQSGAKIACNEEFQVYSWYSGIEWNYNYSYFDSSYTSKYGIPNGKSVDLHNVKTANRTANLATYLPGCNGRAGSSTSRSGINICNSTQSISIYSGGSTSDLIISISNNIFLSTSTYYNTSSNKIVIKPLSLGTALYNLPLSSIRQNGKSGGSVSGFGLSASGGAGGYSIPSLTGPQDATYNAGMSNTGGGRGGTSGTINCSFKFNGNWDGYIAGSVKNYINGNIIIQGNMRFSAGSTGSSGYVSITNFRYCK